MARQPEPVVPRRRRVAPRVDVTKPYGARALRATMGTHEFRVIRLSDCSDAFPHTLDNAVNAVEYLNLRLADSLSYRPDVENFMVVHLNARNRPIGFEVVSNGTLDTILVDPRQVFKSAILANSAAIILAHNHPSGDPSPSDADIKTTRDLIRGGKFLKIDILDHIILGRPQPERPKAWSSLRELGHLAI